MTLGFSLLVTFGISTLEFTGISSFLGPILQVCYPGLIVLTFLNIAYKLTGFNPVKIPVFLAFAAALVFYLT
jgi:LIVCS family branched-chain amino acid:cation transporter